MKHNGVELENYKYCGKCEKICDHCPRSATWVLFDDIHDSSCFCEMIQDCKKPAPIKLYPPPLQDEGEDDREVNAGTSWFFQNFLWFVIQFIFGIVLTQFWNVSRIIFAQNVVKWLWINPPFQTNFIQTIAQCGTLLKNGTFSYFAIVTLIQIHQSLDLIA